ncbi:MAG: hypothetical protein HYV28_11035 [Ignavibacteriales bacterium]|nr:hypothetical protein [Ignavibacteriales bacterium]
MKKHAQWFSFFLFIVFAVSIQAQTLYDPIAGTGTVGGTGTALGTSNGWTGHSGTGIINISTGSLTYTGVPAIAASQGNKISIIGSTTVGKDINIPSGIVTGTTTGYFSALINVTDNTQLAAAFADASYFMHFGGTAGSSVTAFGARVHIKSVNSGANFRLGIQNASTGTVTQTEFPQDLNFGTTYFIVVKLTKSPSPMSAVLWVNPSSVGGEEPAGSVTNSSGTATIANLASVCIRNAAATPKADIDEIRAGTTYASVTPAGGAGAAINASSSLVTFLANAINTPSAEQTMQVSGVNLTGDISIVPPAGYEISTITGGGFTPTNPIVLTQSGGTVSSTPVYIRLNNSVSGAVSGNIVCSSTGATDVNVAVTGGVLTNYYNIASSASDVTTNWGTGTDGSGTNPTNFTTDFAVFNIKNGTEATFTGAWTVSGSNSKVVLGDGTNAINFTIPATAALTGTIDLSANSTITLNNATLPTWGTSTTTSNIVVGTTGPAVVAIPSTVGNLTINGAADTKTFASGAYTIAGNLVIDNVLNFNGAATPFTTLNLAGNFTLQNGATMDASVSPGYTNRLTLNTNGTSTQTLTGNGNEFLLFRIANTNDAGVVLSTTGGSSNVILGNLSGGGLTLTSTLGTFTLNGNTLSLYSLGKGVLLGSGTITGDANATINVGNGTAATTGGVLNFTAGSAVLKNLIINLTATAVGGQVVTLGTSLTVNDTITLTSGRLSLSSNNLILGSSAVILGGSATSFIVPAGTGVVRKPFAAASAFTFPVGDATPLYSPVTVNFNSGTFSAGEVDVKLSKTKHASNTSSTDFISRTWTVASTGISDFNANVTAHYNQADVTGTEANLVGGIWNGSTWTAYSAADAAADTLHFGGVTAFGDFTAGENYVMQNAGRMSVTFIPEGYYSELSSLLAMRDTFKVYLANITSPFAFVDSALAVIDSVNYTGYATFYNAPTGAYYLVVKGRSIVETWSKTGGESFTKGSTGSFSFTSAATQAFGSNMVLKGSQYCVYSGDVNQDNFIDFSDLTEIDNDSYNFASGYLVTDVNGDMFVDFSDLTLVDNNSYNFIGANTPRMSKRTVKPVVKEIKALQLDK